MSLASALNCAKWLAVTLAVALSVPGARAQEPVTLEFVTISLQPLFNDYINGLIDAYEAEHPGTTVTWIDQPADAVQQSLLSSLAAGAPADVVNLNVPYALDLAEQGALQPLDDFLSDEARESYFEGLYNSFNISGEQFGLPWYIAPAVVAYNTELFEQAGLDLENPPATLPELIAAAKQIKDETGVYGFMPNVDGTNMLYRFLEAGLPVMSEDNTEAVFNSPEHVAMLEQYVTLYQDNYFPEDTMRRGYLAATELFTAGQLGMLITGPQFLLRVENDNPEVYEATRVAPYPLDRGEVIHAPLMGLSVPAGVDNPEAAVDFARFVTNDANQLAFSKIVTVFPSTKAASNDPFFTTLPADPTATDEARQIDAEQLAYAVDLTDRLHLPDSSDLFTEFKNNIEQAFFGNKTPQQALDAAVAFWNARL